MLKRFLPKVFADSVFAVNYADLRKRGITALVFDIDNTIVPFDEHAPQKRHVKLFTGLKKRGFALCLLSNNKNPARVERFGKILGAKTISRAKKPSRTGLKRAMTEMNATPRQTAIIGDQIFTDVWCGNRSGVLSVLVKPVSDHDEWQVKLKRIPEKIVFKLLGFRF